jgi:hypothetical protein
MDKKKLLRTAVEAVAVACVIHSMQPRVALADGCGQFCLEGQNCVGAVFYMCASPGSNYFTCNAWNPPSCYDTGGGACDDGSFCQ